MEIDIRSKAVQLLEKIAISVHERDAKNPNLICFNTSEIQLVEKWLKEFIEESCK